MTHLDPDCVAELARYHQKSSDAMMEEILQVYCSCLKSVVAIFHFTVMLLFRLSFPLSSSLPPACPIPLSLPPTIYIFLFLLVYPPPLSPTFSIPPFLLPALPIPPFFLLPLLLTSLFFAFLLPSPFYFSVPLSPFPLSPILPPTLPPLSHPPSHPPPSPWTSLPPSSGNMMRWLPPIFYCYNRSIVENTLSSVCREFCLCLFLIWWLACPQPMTHWAENGLEAAVEICHWFTGPLEGSSKQLHKQLHKISELHMWQY